MSTTSRLLAALAGSTILVIGAAQAGLTARLGAHPFWAQSVAWVGVPLGLLLFLLTTRWNRGRVTLVFAVLAGASLFAAHQGKTTFAASFAENALAGRIWYFGWIAAAGFTAAALATLIHGLTAPRDAA